jgi:hypothetical protein
MLEPTVSCMLRLPPLKVGSPQSKRAQTGPFAAPRVKVPTSLVPAQRPTRLILNHPGLEEVLLLLEVDELAHPRERVGRALE